MPIISNTNDFSNVSASTDDSSLDHFFTEILEMETAKGVYFQRTRFLRDPSSVGSIDHSRLALINVGGDRYTFPWSTLDEFPLSRLGQLRHCRGAKEIALLCDDYDETRHEFFFDRSAATFRIILNFLAAGKLRLLGQSCAISLSDELTYWGIDPAHMESCCRRRMLSCLEEVAKCKQRTEERRSRKLCSGPASEEICSVMSQLREAVDNPHSGWMGKSFACLSVVMIAVTVISLCISTMPDLREEESRGECSQRCRHIFIVETVCVAWFSLELALRFMQARSKLVFAREPLNIIDALAILPYYISLVVGEKDRSPGMPTAGGASRGYLDKLGLILRVIRALRILYVMRLGRHSLGLQTLGLTMQRSTRELGLLLLFLFVAVALFSPLVHLAENELAVGPPVEPNSFSSIPASYWWSVISMTTVGYGDMVPLSIPGQVVAFSSILSGILIIAFPATSIFHVFSCSYRELKQEHAVSYKEERAAFLAASAAEEVRRKSETRPHAWLQVDTNKGCNDENGTSSHQPIITHTAC
ncbi:hypothetical protein P4O66_006755 [Electrophorus voltai]|uniref:BTB domain-containing protein n=1 Tax=Electrophorus voltai TaxID=2609070 RepID=A0AAD8ZHC9_9TELE|nr:hypothetical protein P4O66_006755 [Electrophorus voltai]